MGLWAKHLGLQEMDVVDGVTDAIQWKAGQRPPGATVKEFDESETDPRQGIEPKGSARRSIRRRIAILRRF